MKIGTAGDLLRFLEKHPEYLSYKLRLDSAELMSGPEILDVDVDEFGDEVLWLYASSPETHRLRRACQRALDSVTDPELREVMLKAIAGQD